MPWILKVWEEPIRVFPDDYIVLRNEFYKGDTRLIGSFESKRLPRVMEATKKERKEKLEFKVIGIDLAGIPYFLALRDFHMYDKNNQKAKSPNSEAIYIARSENKMDGLLLQYLPPNSKTSRHYHKHKTENYHLIAGKAKIETSVGNQTLEHATTHTIKPEVTHQVVTEKEPSLILLEILGDPEGLSMNDHNYV